MPDVIIENYSDIIRVSISALKSYNQVVRRVTNIDSEEISFKLSDLTEGSKVCPDQESSPCHCSLLAQRSFSKLEG